MKAIFLLNLIIKLECVHAVLKQLAAVVYNAVKNAKMLA